MTRLHTRTRTKSHTRRAAPEGLRFGVREGTDSTSEIVLPADGTLQVTDGTTLYLPGEAEAGTDFINLGKMEFTDGANLIANNGSALTNYGTIQLKDEGVFTSANHGLFTNEGTFVIAYVNLPGFDGEFYNSCDGVISGEVDGYLPIVQEENCR